jgi:hypothetical protein
MVGSSGDVYVSRKDPILGTMMLPCPSIQPAGAYTSGGQAADWVASQLEEGKAVLVSLVSVVARQAMCAVLKAVPAGDTAALAVASRDFPVLAIPTGVQRVTSFMTSTVGMLFGAAALVGVLAWAAGAFKRRK